VDRWGAGRVGIKSQIVARRFYNTLIILILAATDSKQVTAAEY